MENRLVWQTSRFLNRHVLNKFRVQLVRPTTLHGPPSSIGVVDWSHRLWGMATLVDQIADVPGDFAECGVFFGYGVLLMLHLTRSSRPARRIWGFDSFQGHPPQAPADASTQQAEALQDYWRVSEQDVWRTLSLGTGLSIEALRERVTLKAGWFSETMPTFKGQLAFVELDPDYYQSTKDALAYLWPLVAARGVMMFGQLENATLPGKGVAIKEFLASPEGRNATLCQEPLSGQHYLLKKA